MSNDGSETAAWPPFISGIIAGVLVLYPITALYFWKDHREFAVWTTLCWGAVGFMWSMKR